MALYHTAKGPVNYTVVGNPTIKDGVVSGFSDNDYLQLTSQFDITKDFEAVFNVETGPADTISNYQRIWSYDCNGANGIWINNRVLYWSIAGNNIAILNNGDYSISGNTNYLIRARHINGVYYLDHSIDNGTTWRGKTSQTFSHTGSITQSNTYLGNGTSYPHTWLGSIDLNETYIKVNGQPWFGNCPVEVKRHQIMGPVGYNVVGSPTIKDGIVTDFTTTSYLRTNLQFDFSQTDYEYVIRATPHAVTTRSAAIVGTQGSGFRIYFQQNSIQCYPGNDTVFSVNGTFDVSSFYYVRLIRKGNVYTLDYSLDGINYTSARSLTSQQHLSRNLFLQFGYYGGDGWDPLDGKIDFNHTYIKVNGSLWFYQPQETKYIIRDGKLVWADPRIALSGPVNYAVVGNPTITDNIITQANASNYVNITSADIPYTQYWEFVTYVQLGTRSSYGINNANNANGKARWQIGRNGTKLRFIAGYDNGWAIDITGPTNFSAGDWIYIKLNFTAATRTFTLYSSVDGVNWTNEVTASSQVYEDGTGNILRLMNDTSSEPAFLSMDLNKTYIKTDESLWFYGKNYATSNIAPVPAGFTYSTTTTPSIGYVDMRTQTFTAAPEGSVIGRDE